MNEFNINLVGKEENIKKEEIFNNFDFNYLPMNNLPISYFPLKNQSILSNNLKDNIDINNNDSIEQNLNVIDTSYVENATYDTTYKYYIFKKGDINLNILKNINVDILIVGGGGGGGNGSYSSDEGGGGGAGGVVYIKNKILKKGNYKIKIGNGGNATKNGEDSYIKYYNNTEVIIEDNYNNSDGELIINKISLIGYGGGYGAGLGDANDICRPGNNGGSGGGGYQSSKDPTCFNNGKRTQGKTLYDGTKYIYGGNNGSTVNSIGYAGCGGGAGGNAIDFNINGPGYNINITNNDVTYAVGGKSGNSRETANGFPNTGNGGNGGYRQQGQQSGTGSKGGSGVIIIKYNINDIDYIKYFIDTITYINLSIEDTYDNPDFKLLVYRSSGSLKLNKDIICDILLVGGGGGGGINKDIEGGGGGGGGKVCIAKSFILSSGTYNITIGIGGNSKPYESPFNVDGNAGGITNIIKTSPETTILSAIGGGGGGSTDNNNLDGGSGGGASGHVNDRSGGTVTIPSITNNNVYYYGNKGGDGKHLKGGGGGGGAGNAGLSSDTLNGGNGGNGILSTITGQNKYYGGGGGGASGDGGKSGGIGGKGGGGNGANRTDILKGLDGEMNTGGGGGGSSKGKSGAGGSGIVIIRVRKEDINYKFKSSTELNKIEDRDIRIINDVKSELRKKINFFENNDIPYNKFSILPLVILILLFWIFIFLFLLKFVHHYFAYIYLYILICIIIFLLLFGSLWFLYSNNDL